MSLRKKDLSFVKFKGFLIGIKNKKTGKWLITSYGDNAELQEWTPRQVMKSNSPAFLDFVDAERERLNLTKMEMVKRLKHLKKVV
jgi:hypothetical protein